MLCLAAPRRAAPRCSVERLQNNPPRFIPKEDLAIGHIRKVLDPFSEENGGPLKIQHVTYVEGRGNLIVEYPVSTQDRFCYSVDEVD